MSINFDIPWPKKDDSLHKNSDKGSESLIKALTPSFFALASAYKKAADSTYKHRGDYRAWEVDSLVYPMFFLYRQYIELMLKEIIKTGDGIFQTHKLDENFHHKLLKLWNESEALLDKADLIGNNNDHINVEKIIKEFDKVDPLSFSFRYPIDKDGNENLSELDSINLTNLYEIMQSVSNYLTSCIDSLYNFKVYMQN